MRNHTPTHAPLAPLDVQLNTPDPSVFSVNTDDRAAGSPQDQLVTWCSYADDCSAEPYAPLCQTGPGTTCTARSDADLSGYGGGGGGGGGSSDASKGDDDDDGLDGTLIAIVVVGILLFLAVLIAVVMMVVGKNNDDPGGWSGASTGTRGREDGAQQIVAFDNPNYSSDIDMSSRVPMELPYQAPQPWSDESDQGLYAPVDNDDVTVSVFSFAVRISNADKCTWAQAAIWLCVHAACAQPIPSLCGRSSGSGLISEDKPEARQGGEDSTLQLDMYLVC